MFIAEQRHCGPLPAKAFLIQNVFHRQVIHILLKLLHIKHLSYTDTDFPAFCRQGLLLSRLHLNCFFVAHDSRGTDDLLPGFFRNAQGGIPV